MPTVNGKAHYTMKPSRIRFEKVLMPMDTKWQTKRLVSLTRDAGKEVIN
jgi:hypothetical protein